MKKTFLLCTLTVLLSLHAIGQIPEKFNYQGILRNSSGDLVKNTSITVKIYLLADSTSGEVQYSESHAVTTSNYGQFTIQVGGGTDVTGVFTTIDWSQHMYLKTEVANPAGGTLVDLGIVHLISVPYALYAKNVANNNDADADPANEIQVISISNDSVYLTSGGFIKLPADQVNDADSDTLNEIQDLNFSSNILTITKKSNPTQINLASYQGTNTDEQVLHLSGDTLAISGGNNIVLPYDSSRWVLNGNKLYYSTGNVGIGSSDPMSKLEVKSSGTGALFQVINANNDTVFAVYPDGVKVFVDPEAKGTVGGFAVSGRTPTKLGEKVEYFRVTPDSTRIYVNDSVSSKGTVGGFAVSGRTPTKGFLKDYLVVTADSTRIYVNDTSITKGTVGGFAVSGRTPTKGVVKPFMDMTRNNYFIGHEAGKSNTSGLFNSFIGYQSGILNSSGSSNSLMGYQAGYSNTEGSNNLLLGYQSGYSNTTGSYNTFMGYKAGYTNTTGDKNSFVGSFTGINNAEGSNNTFSGYNAGYSNISGEANNFYGTNSGFSNTTGKNNSFFGPESGYLNDTASYNTFIGYRAGYNNKSNNNVFIGNECGFANTTGNVNVFIGYAAGRSNTIGSGNLFMGNESGFTNMYGESNVFMGERAGYQNISGSDNVFIGYQAGMSGESAWANVCIGYKSGQSLTQAVSNVFIGESSGKNTTWGESNVFIGNEAGRSNITGGSNVMIGTGAGDAANASNNIFIGFGTGYETTSGNSNVFVGSQSGFKNTTGKNNVFVGTGAGYANQIGENNVFIGNSAGWYETGSDKLYIENSSADNSTALIYGDFNADLLRFNANVAIGIAPATTYKFYVYEPAATSTSISRAGYFQGNGGSTSGAAYGVTSYSYAYGSSASYAIFADGDGGSTTGPEYAFYGLGKGYFSNNVGIGAANSDERLVIKMGGTSWASAHFALEASATTDRWDIINNGADLYFGFNESSLIIFRNNGNIIPRTDKGSDLGEVGYAWDDIYYDDLWNQGAAAFTDRIVTDEILLHPPKPKLSGMLDYKTERGLEELDPNSLPKDLTNGEFYILTDEMASYNYKANYEQQLQIEILKKENIELKKRLDQLEGLKAEIETIKAVIREK